MTGVSVFTNHCAVTGRTAGSDCWYDLGMCHMLGGAYGEALAAFDSAAAASPHDARFAANRAAALGMLGRYDAALETYLKIMPPADAHYNLGVLCEARQDNRRAQDEFDRAQALRDAATPAPGESPRTTKPRPGASRS